MPTNPGRRRAGPPARRRAGAWRPLAWLPLALAGGAACAAAARIDTAAGRAPAAPPPIVVARNLADLSLEELRDVVVSSVLRRDQSLLDAAASVYVISGDEIRRAGIATLPEALRLAPNLQVAAIDARQYAISARGFNGNVVNKLLVMVDGRTIYSPLFSGVFWDAQDFVPSDIDRIEVVSGPAGATWGTNAVNGVINVVTLGAAKTRGAAVTATAGNLEKAAVGRYGFALSDDVAVRVHAKTSSAGRAGCAAAATPATPRAARPSACAPTARAATTPGC